MIKKYRTVPVVIEAVQFDGSNVKEIESFVDDGSLEVMTFYCCDIPCSYCLDICTLEGRMHISEGDYIVKGLRGEFYPCKPDVFKKKYIELQLLGGKSMISWWSERDDDGSYRIDVITDDVHVLEKITDVCTSKACAEDAYRNTIAEIRGSGKE